jgi:TatD DNase family protein
LDLGKFDADRAEVIRRAKEAGLGRILIPGITLESSRRIVRLVETDEMLYAAVGVHPSDALTWDGQAIPALRELATRLKVVAIGEIGLDYYWDAAPHEHQRRVLKEQLALAAELELPAVIHLREKDDAQDGDCASDLIQILEEWVNRLRVEMNPLAERPGVLHSFSGSRETARRALALNFHIGVTGPLTYKNAESKRQLIAGLPLEGILIETDAPYLAPVPERGKRNEPAFVRHIADKIAQLHFRNPEEVAAVTTANAARLFSWGG